MFLLTATLRIVASYYRSGIFLNLQAPLFMKKSILYILALCISAAIYGQSKTTESLHKKFDGSLSLFFYKNTLRMLNQSDNKEFDELIKNIEKMKFLVLDKASKNFGPLEYMKLKGEYVAEEYESVMTSRMDGRNFDVYMKDKKGSSLGTVVLVNDSTNLYVLDMIGTIDLSKAGALFSTIDQSTDIGERIRNFAEHKDKKEKRKEDKSDH